MATMRAASEPILFPTLLDFFYFAYIFAFFRHAPARAERPAIPAHQATPAPCHP
jgi:hypothetical protein